MDFSLLEIAAIAIAIEEEVQCTNSKRRWKNEHQNENLLRSTNI